jgi:L-ascorbate metabolism protein UlaG (beta-lactamase superfamily)
MKITKFGHCCLLIEEQGKRILTDPGIYTTEQNVVKNIDAILITHEHADHFHTESLKEILKNNPQTVIITNSVVAGLINNEIPEAVVVVVENTQRADVDSVSIEGFGEKHAPFHKLIPESTNTSYLIANKLFFPGDAFTNPNREVEILALPVAGPWMNIGQAIDYALDLKPKIAFPVHDGGLKSPASLERWLGAVLPKEGIDLKMIELNQETEI